MMNNTLSKLIELTQIKETEILKLLDKTQEQCDAIMQDDIDRLLDITESKQNIINYINTINQEFKENYIISENDSEFNTIRPILELKSRRIINTTHIVKKLETENQKELQQRISETQGHIRQIRSGKKNMKAYFVSMPESVHINHQN